jgi:hypothetical protein
MTHGLSIANTHEKPCTKNIADCLKTLFMMGVKKQLIAQHLNTAKPHSFAVSHTNGTLCSQRDITDKSAG